MITITITIAICVLLWQFITWRLFRTARTCVHNAVLATSQCLDRQATVKLTDEERDRARAMAAEFALGMLGRWRGLLLRVALGCWDLCGWLDAEIESAVHELKTKGALPMSEQSMLARNPIIDLAAKLMRELTVRFTPNENPPPFDPICPLNENSRTTP